MFKTFHRNGGTSPNKWGIIPHLFFTRLSCFLIQFQSSSKYIIINGLN